MPLGPNRAPGRYDVPVSNGAPAVVQYCMFETVLALTYEGNVIFLMVACEAREVWETAKGGDAREDRVGLFMVRVLRR